MPSDTRCFSAACPRTRVDGNCPLERIRRDNFIAGDCRDRAESRQTHGVLDELDVPVEHQHVDTSRVKAPRAHRSRLAAAIDAIEILAVGHEKMLYDAMM